MNTRTQARMNASAVADLKERTFPTRIPAFVFQAWRMGVERNEAHPLDIADALSLDEARDAAAMSCRHKDHFVVKAIDTLANKAVVHVFVVKQRSKPTYVRQPGFAHAVQQKPLYAEPVFSMAVTEFAPVEPWKWTPGCDVVGASS